MQKKKFQLSAVSLRWIALVCMLLDHLWGTITPGNNWMNYLGRIAFPIFAFQIAEGYVHTHNYIKYRNRLFLLALISEIPFDLMMYSTWFFPFHQNTIFTLLAGLCAIHCIDDIQAGKISRHLGCLKLLGIFLIGTISLSDYGPLGIVTVMVFYLIRHFHGWHIVLTAAIILIHAYGYQGKEIPFYVFKTEYFLPVQAFAVFGLIPIFLYRGEKGTNSKFLQILSYIFYPVHMLMLHFL